MTHPEFNMEEDEPRIPLIDDEEDDDDSAETQGLLGQQASILRTSLPVNTNNNAVDGDPVSIVAFQSESPLHSLETSI